MGSEVTWPAHDLEMNGSEVLEVAHGNVEHFERVTLLLFVVKRYPEESISISGLMWRVIEQLLVPMRMSLHRD